MSERQSSAIPPLLSLCFCYSVFRPSELDAEHRIHLHQCRPGTNPFRCDKYVITDVIIIILPIPQLWHLKMSRSQKLQLTGVFTSLPSRYQKLRVVLSVSTISIVRVIYLDTVSFQDVTWTLTDSLIWTSAEVCVAVVSACLPTLRPLFSVVKRGSSGMRSTRFW